MTDTSEFSTLLYAFLEARDDYLNALATSDKCDALYAGMKEAKERLFSWVGNNT